MARCPRPPHPVQRRHPPGELTWEVIAGEPWVSTSGASVGSGRRVREAWEESGGCI